MALRMHIAKKQKKKYKKEKSRYSYLFLIAAEQTPPRKHQKFAFSNSDASKKETVHKRCHRPIIDHRFSPWRKTPLTKQCLQQGHCQAQPIKARPWIFTLQGKALNFSCAVAPTFRCRCYKSQITKQVPHCYKDSNHHC
jgi:hypothetical protein